MGFVQHKGEEDDDMRILMWMLATVEEGKEVWAMGKRPEVLIPESPFSESALNASPQKIPLLFKGR